MEPALHIDVGLILEGPQLAGPHTEPDREEIDGEGEWNHQEGDDASGLGAAGEFIQENKTQEDDDEHPPLCERVFAIDLEKHRLLVKCDCLVA